jgi:hypothetical protein
MTIGEVQQMHVAKTGHVVDIGRLPRRGAPACQREACGRCRDQDLKKFAAIHVDLRLPAQTHRGPRLAVPGNLAGRARFAEMRRLTVVPALAGTQCRSSRRRNVSSLPSFPRKRESIGSLRNMDPRLRGDDASVSTRRDASRLALGRMHHLLTGDCGSINSAVTSLICCSVRIWL